MKKQTSATTAGSLLMTSMRLPSELAAQLDALAVDLGRSYKFKVTRSDVILKLIREGLDCDGGET